MRLPWLAGPLLLAGACAAQRPDQLAARLDRIEERLASVEEEARAVRARHQQEDLQRVLTPSVWPLPVAR